jgi:hypothetical protein
VTIARDSTTTNQQHTPRNEIFQVTPFDANNPLIAVGEAEERKKKSTTMYRFLLG